jgi:glycosyltransferase involved in cell wall biosynthesis
MGISVIKKYLDPKISVIIPFFNAEKTLSRAVGSILDQEGVDWELILVNDGSLDNSEKIANNYVADPRVVLLSQENLGVSAARNFGARKAKSEWLIFLDSDDSLNKNTLRSFLNSIESHENRPDVVYSSYLITKDGKDKVYSSSKLAGSYCIRRESFWSVGGFDEKMTYGENSELFRRLRQNEFKFYQGKFISVNYFESKNGGSKNLLNLVHSNNYLLKKHKDYFTNNLNEKAIYLQILGVAYLRLGEFQKARSCFIECIKINFLTPKFWLRFVLSSFPFLSKRVYPLNGIFLQ